MRQRLLLATLLPALLAACSWVPTAPPTPSPSPSSVAPQEPLLSAFEQVRSSVVRIESATCEAYTQGSGFLAGGGDLVVTAAHVVQDAARIRVVSGSTSARARVVGIDVNKDLALLRVPTSLGTGLDWSPEPAVERDEVAAVGFTGGESMSWKAGQVNGLNRKGMTMEGNIITGMVEFDSIADAGNSGGPVVDEDARVVGVFSAGQGQSRYFVPSETASPLIEAWADNDPVGAPEVDCVPFMTPDGETLDMGTDPALSGAAHTLSTYAGMVNAGDYDSALSLFADERDPEAFSKGMESSFVGDWALRSSAVNDKNPTLWYTFQSRQQAGKGPRGRESETCSQWSLDYTFKQVGGLWQIDSVLPHWPDAGQSIPCETRWPAETPVKGASEPVANVGRLADTVPDSGDLVEAWPAVAFCEPDRLYDGFAERRASRFTSNLSKSGDSASSVGLIVLTRPDTAESLMDEMKAAATACEGEATEDEWLVIDPPDGFAQAFAVASEQPWTTESDLGGGTITLVARRGRSIVAVSNWMYYWTPIGDGSTVWPEMAEEVERLLEALPNG